MPDSEQRMREIERQLLQMGFRLGRMEEMLTKIEDNSKWLRRTLIGALVGCVFTSGAAMLVWLIQT